MQMTDSRFIFVKTQDDETAEMLEQVKTDYHSTTDSIMEYQKNI